MIILDNQQGFRAARQWSGLAGFTRHARQPLDAREINLEGRTLAKLAGDVDKAPGKLHDGLAGHQPQAGALAGSLGRKKRLKQVRFDFIRHAGSCIADTEHHIVPGSCSCPTTRVVLIESDVTRSDRELAASGHRIAGVDGQVH